MVNFNDDDLLEAHLVHLGDVEALGDFDERQLDYLRSVDLLPDPETDGIECDHEEPHL